MFTFAIFLINLWSLPLFFVIADIIVTRTSYYSKWFGVKWNVWILSYEFIILKNLCQTTLSFKIPILDEMNLMRNVQNVLGISIITKSWTFYHKSINIHTWLQRLFRTKNAWMRTPYSNNWNQNSFWKALWMFGETSLKYLQNLTCFWAK